MIFVTGASGFLGSYLTRLLISKGYKVRALYRQDIPSFPGSDGIDWVKGDILDYAVLEGVMRQVESVYHCAAFVSFQPGDRPEMLRCNQEGTRNVVNSCLANGVKRLLLVSSVSSLGNIFSNVPIDETMEWSPKDGLSIYGQSKYLSETEVWRGIGRGLNAVIANPAIILGAGDWGRRGSPEIFKTAYQSFPWYTDGICGFVDVDDVARALILLMNSAFHSEKFILCAENVPYKDLYTSICNEFGSKPPHKRITPFMAGLVWRAEKIRSLFSNAPILLTKETAAASLSTIRFDNQKFLRSFPGFSYTPFRESIQRICGEYKQQMK